MRLEKIYGHLWRMSTAKGAAIPVGYKNIPYVVVIGGGWSRRL